MTPKYIVIHTAAYSGNNCDADLIDQWHRQRGWNGIGYHYVILNDKHSNKADGTVESGRSESVGGAHARGINSKSLGICCVGHGDREDFTAAQYANLYQLLNRLCKQYNIPAQRVIGHRELNQLIAKGELAPHYRTDKSCPGNKVDMDALRERLSLLSGAAAELPPTSSEQAAVRQAVAVLEQHQYLYPNAVDEFREFRSHPELLVITENSDD